MKKTIKRIAVFAICFITTFCGTGIVARADTGYSYTYDWWKVVQYAPTPYQVACLYTAADLGLDKNFNLPQGMFVHENMIYVCDSGNNRIVEIERVDFDTLKVTRIITEIKGDTDVKDLKNPTDIAVTDDGYMYIADKDNNRIVKIDMDLNYVMEFVRPTEDIFDQDLSFTPHKIAVDTAGRVYCVASNVNKGLMKYENDGTFFGFVGATPVTFNWTDYIWKRFLSTQAQREQMISFVPTEYDNIYMDYEGFIYVCTTHVDEDALDRGDADSIRKLNLMGNDILVRNGNYSPLGDLYWGAAGGYKGPSLLVDITVMDNDTYYAIDKNRGRIFGYDDQGRLLYAFGGSGNMDGYFRMPVAIEHIGHDLFVLDSLDRSITLFTPTEYGRTIFSAMEQFQDGLYEESGESWRSVMNQNGNYDLAYIGLGRAHLRQKEYREAMDYFKLKWDDENYSKAFKQYRKEWVEENIALIVIAILVLAIVPMTIGKVKKIKREIDTADIFREDWRKG